MTDRKSGIEIRETNRDKQEQKRLQLARKLIDQHIDFIKLEKSEDRQQLFNLMWKNFDTKLSTNKHLQDAKNYSDSYNHAVKYCQEHIEDKDIYVGFPKLIINSLRPKSFRTQKWFENSKIVLDFYLGWMKKLETRNSIDITKSDIFLSLVFHSAVLKVAVLQALLEQISKNCLMIQEISGLPVITAIVDNSSYHTNTYVESKAVHQTQVFISPLTARIIQLYSKNNKVIDVSTSETFDIYRLYQRILTIEKNKGGNIDFSLKEFLEGAIYVLENYLELDIPEHTWYLIADNKETTYSLATSNWQSLIHDVRHDVINKQESLVNQQTSTSDSPVKSNPKLTVQIAKLFKRNTTSKIPKIVFTRELTELHQELISNDAPLSEKVIVGFLLSKTVNYQVSSIYTDSNWITNRWLGLTQDVVLENYQEEDFVALYDEMIELSKGEKAKNRVASVIDKVHKFMVQHYNVEPIANLSKSERAHHKVGYISENMFQAIITKINELEVTVDQKQALSLALILGHRCGLRIGEIVKIRLRDVAQTQNYLEVRNNKFGNNKSLSALRRVLLAQLLVESDTRLLKRVYIKRLGDTGQTLIANQDGVPYDAKVLSKMLGSIIKEITGLSYLTTHHLRHSCLSNFQLMSFLYDKEYQFSTHSSSTFLKSLLPYEDDQALRIISYFETNLAYKKIYALTGIAGHASPSTTFSSYVHFTDIQIGLLLWHTNFKLSIKHAHLLQIPRRKKSCIENSPLKINEFLIEKLKLSEIDKPKNSKIFDIKQDDGTKRYSFDEVHQILSRYDPEGNFKDLINACDASEGTVKQWYYNAQQLTQVAEFQTTKGNPKLFASRSKTNFLPVKNRFDDDKRVMTQMTDKFRSLYKESSNKQSIHQFVRQTLTHAQYHKNFIKFNNAIEFYNYLKIICQLIYKKNIRLKLYYYDQAVESDQDAWKLALKTIPRSQIERIKDKRIEKTSYQKRIRVELSLASQTESVRIKNRVDSAKPINQWSVRTIQIFCHYVYIMIGERL